MAEANSSLLSGQNTVATFHQKLQREWKRKAYCGREYVLSSEIVKWMLRANTNEPTNNAGFLLIAVFKGRPHHFQSADIANGDRRCLVVFAILLELGHGHLIHIFQRCNVLDNNLDTHYIPFEQLQRDLRREGVHNAKGLLESFQAKVWQYCPCRLGRNRSIFGDPRWIMPFCKRQKVNQGGTAQVWEVAIPEALIPSALASVLERSKYYDNEYGVCYTLALKTFTQESSEVFYFEKAAYQALRDKSGMIRYLGEYEIDEEYEGSVTRTWNILLEYGDMDLDEFFASPGNFAPNLNAETIDFWKSLVNVADALDRMHNLDITREDGKTDNFHGWHADLKPENILRVHGEFKLADFGFARFKPKDLSRVPLEHLAGGTETYGAPECDRERRDRGTRTSVSQTIDTWSFGCVLSVSATWVVLGNHGVFAYHKVRYDAISKLRQRRASGEDISVPKAGDAFHDGRNVLPEVVEWHNYLRNAMRRSDTITGPILDIIDHHMLLAEPGRRYESRKMCNALHNWLDGAPSRYKRLLERGDIKPVAECIEEALLNVERDSPKNLRGSEATEWSDNTSMSHIASTPTGNINARSLDASQYHYYPAKSSRINKAERMRRAVQGTVAHRTDALRRITQQSSSSSTTTPVAETLPFGSTHATGPLTPERANYNLFESPLPDNSAFAKLRRPPGQDKLENIQHMPLRQLPTSPALEIANNAVSGQEYVAADPVRYRETLTESPEYDDPKSRTGLPPRDGSLHSNSRQLQLMTGSKYSHNSPPRLDDVFTSLHGTPTVRVAPPSHFEVDPAWPIYKEYEALKNGKGLMSLLSGRRNHDKTLQQFLVDRDIKFLVDNDSTMLPFWDAMTIVLKTLASKVEGLDENGLDLDFTVGPDHKAENVSCKRLMAKFGDAKKSALSREKGIEIETDMAAVLSRVFDNYLRHPSRAMTLIVLTNGVWDETQSSTKVDEIIAEFLKKPFLANKLEERWFTIGFISFGDAGMALLKRLDDEIANRYSVPDVVDTEPVSGDVHKMILGSFSPKYDAIPTPTSPSTPLGLFPFLQEGSSVATTTPPTSLSRRNSARSENKPSRFSFLKRP